MKVTQEIDTSSEAEILPEIGRRRKPSLFLVVVFAAITACVVFALAATALGILIFRPTTDAKCSDNPGNLNNQIIVLGKVSNKLYLLGSNSMVMNRWEAARYCSSLSWHIQLAFLEYPMEEFVADAIRTVRNTHSDEVQVWTSNNFNHRSLKIPAQNRTGSNNLTSEEFEYEDEERVPISCNAFVVNDSDYDFEEISCVKLLPVLCVIQG